LLAIFLGTLVGVLLLAAVGVIGSDTGLSAMAALKLSLGARREPAGAAQPAATDRLGLVRNHRHARCRQPAGRAGVQRRQPAGQPDAVDAVFGALATLLAVSGPLTFVRQILRKWGIWLLLAACLWLTWNLFAKADLAACGRRPVTVRCRCRGLRYRHRHAAVVAAADRRLLAFRQAREKRVRRHRAGFLYRQLLADEPGRGLHPGVRASGEVNALLLALAGAGLGIPLLLICWTSRKTPLPTFLGGGFQRHAVALEGRAPGAGHRRDLHLDRLLAPLAQYQNFLLLIGSVFAPLFGVVLVDHFILRRVARRVSRIALAGAAGLAGRDQHLSAGQSVSGYRRDPAGAGAGRAAASCWAGPSAAAGKQLGLDDAVQARVGIFSSTWPSA
jgi:NCS1 family nucleobase:cation symporter-1